MRIVCVGGGPAGLFFAILMKKSDPDHEVVVLERKPPERAGGWGVVFWDDLLADLGDNDADTAGRIGEKAFRWNGQILELEGVRAEHEGCGYGIARSQALAILTERATALGVDIRFDREVTSPRDVPDADIVVACDGASSVLRRAGRDRFGTNVGVGRNKYVWLGTTRVFDAFTFAFVKTEAGWIWFHAYAFDAQTSTCIVECAPETWKGLGFDTRSACESLQLLEEIFASQLEGEPLISATDDEVLPWLTFRTVTNDRWYSHETVLMGDAAHTTHFSIGSGMRLAFQDAIALAAELQRRPNPEVAFAAYEKVRRAALARPQHEAHFSRKWFEDAERYVHLSAPALFVVLRARRDPVLARLSPKVYYRLYTIVDKVGVLRTLRRRIGPKARTLYSRQWRRTDAKVGGDTVDASRRGAAAASLVDEAGTREA
jgi:anthraniloyl-CoA monooxygenase